MHINSFINSNSKYEIRLSPSGKLYLDILDNSTKTAFQNSLYKLFLKDWKEGWFNLAAEKISINNDCISLKFWQEIAEDYITKLCHVPEEQEFSFIKAPQLDLLNNWLNKAPPMTGGEYLSLSMIKMMWDQLNTWVEQTIKEDNGIHLFLKKRAPKWQKVGKVCFHLAENKNNHEYPFAFLATYSIGFGTTGKLKHLPLKKALEQYSGEKNKQALIKLLTPVYNASKRCSWINNLVKSAEIYHPLLWTCKKAYTFLTSIPELEECGMSIRVPNWWKSRARPQVSVTIGDDRTVPDMGLKTMLDFKIEIALGDKNLSLEELQKLYESEEKIVNFNGQWIEIDKEKLKQALEHWEKVQQKTKNGQISFIEGMRLLAGSSTSLQDDNILEEQISWSKITAGKALSNLLKQLRDPSLLSSNKVYANINATLRPYQQEGINWLTLLSSLGLGACLADDMGLGKTLQILSLLIMHQQRNINNFCKNPSLLIIPASLLGNWKQEAKKFTPSIKLLFIHTSEIKKKFISELETNPEKYLQDIDLVITTYSMVTRLKWFSKINWHMLILDEAQAIKNAATKQSRSIKTLKSFSRIALTGTPIENRLSELWSLFDFLNPGLLGSSNRFKDYIKTLQNSKKQFEPLRKLISPYILRRMKTDPKIISDLPKKIEIPTYCYLTKIQIKYYQGIVNDLKTCLENIDPKNRRGIVLQTLLRLKQICNHPNQFNESDVDYKASQSGKFIRLDQICEELASRQEKVLIFTQFKSIIDPLAMHLKSIFGREGLTLHGNTPIKERKSLVESFQSDNGPPFFILSLKAGGTGLNLTAASHVIHFDRWWNPAVENQATDRAFRIGQKKNVQVHKFITMGTIEEQIDKIISAKKKLTNEILNKTDEINIIEMSDEELLNLIKLDVEKSKLD